MNILQILPTLDIGGVETGTIDLARYLVKNGHKAIVVSGGGRLVKELEAIGSRHYMLPVGKKSLFNIIRMVNELSDIIRREDIDIVHARSRVPALIAYFACKRTNRVLITTAHGYYTKHLMSESMGWGKFVIVASNIMAKHMAGPFNVPYDRIKLIPRGVDLSQFTLRQEKPAGANEFVIGIVSRITPLKGHSDFIKAISLIRGQIPGLKVLIVGSAPKDKYREDIELLIRQLGLSKTIELTGARQDVPKVMSGLDMLLSATVTPEAFGRVIIEAQAIGVPVVATNVGGVVDIVENEETGLLCEPQNPRDMADKILKLYRDNELARRMVIKARKRVEEDFNSDKMMQRTLAVYEEAIKTQNILIIKMSAIGDVILSIPSLRAIRAKYPNARIKVLTALSSREVLDGCPYINDRIVCDFKERHKGIKGLWWLAREVRKECFEIVIDLQNNRKSHILAYLSLAGLRYGYDNGKLSFLLNRKIKNDAPHLDPIEHQFRALRMAGVKPADKQLALWPSERDKAWAKKFLEDNWVRQGQNLIGINVRASTRWVSKNWPSGHIVELCDRLAKEYNVRVILTGTDEDVEYAEAIASSARSKPIISAGKTTVMELAALIKCFKVFLTPDSAPMHIASAMGTPFVALFGPTDPARHVAPSGNCVVLCKAREVRCSPCYKSECRKKVICMRKITVDDVLEAVKVFLPRQKEGDAK
ncbi:MAG: lipopolysaccharide heptosyltransferase II [Candidatus Omnitrophica bacterium]|nr:lipopolysaccharide heptosyltransferase II [Candidatus Omnitrophota bacterium]